MWSGHARVGKLLSGGQEACSPSSPRHPACRFSLSTTHSFAALPPAQQSALRDTHNEYFFSRHEELWRASGLAKLPAIMGASDMLVCGEDLGFVPACVPPAMQVCAPQLIRLRCISHAGPAGLGTWV